MPRRGVVVLLLAAQCLAVALSVAGRGGHPRLAWGLAAVALVVVLLSLLALASRQDGGLRAGGALVLAAVAQVALVAMLAYGAGPALRDAYLGVAGRTERVFVAVPVVQAASLSADAPRETYRAVRLSLVRVGGGPVPGGSTVPDALVPGDVYATYMTRVRARLPTAAPAIDVRVDPLGVVAPLPLTSDGDVARTSPLLPAGPFLGAWLTVWGALLALVLLPERRHRAHARRAREVARAGRAPAQPPNSPSATERACTADHTARCRSTGAARS